MNVLCWLLLVLELLLRAASQTDSPSCTSLNELITNTNRDEMICRLQEDCTGVQCNTNATNNHVRLFLQLTRLTILPCANHSDTPAILVELLGANDPITAQRRELFKEELKNDTIVPLIFNGIIFGNINITFDLHEDDSIGFAIQRYDASQMETVRVINYTNIVVDFSHCPTTTGMPTTTSAPLTIIETSQSSTTNLERTVTRDISDVNTTVNATTNFEVSFDTTISKGWRLASNCSLVLIVALFLVTRTLWSSH